MFLCYFGNFYVVFVSIVVRHGIVRPEIIDRKVILNLWWRNVEMKVNVLKNVMKR